MIESFIISLVRWLVQWLVRWLVPCSTLIVVPLIFFNGCLNPSFQKCDRLIERSVLNPGWLNPMLYSFIGCHLFMFLGLSVANRGIICFQPKYLLLLEWSSTTLISGDEEDEISKKPSVIEANGKTFEIQKLI